MLSVTRPSSKLVRPGSGDLLYLLFLYVFAAALLLLCTPNSPLFSTQSWVDPNVYMDVGRALNEGRVFIFCRLYVWVQASFFFSKHPGSIYSDGGGSPEEILLPCFMGSLYFVLKALISAKENTSGSTPGSSSGSSVLRPFWFHGLFLGIALLTKFNLVVFLAVCSLLLFHVLSTGPQREASWIV